MGQVTGFLLQVSEKATSNGGTIYNIKVENDGNDDWFGYGFDAPTFGVDSEISFDIEVNGKFENVIVETLEIIDNQNAPAPARKARGGTGGGRAPRGGAAKPAGRAPRGGAAPARKPRGQAADDKPARAPKADKKADVDWDRKDRLIRAQSCQNTAVATVALHIQAGTLALPKKKGEQYDALMALVEKETHRLFLKYDEVADECYDYGDEEGGDEGNAGYDDDAGIPE